MFYISFYMIRSIFFFFKSHFSFQIHTQGTKDGIGFLCHLLSLTSTHYSLVLRRILRLSKYKEAMWLLTSTRRRLGGVASLLTDAFIERLPLSHDSPPSLHFASLIEGTQENIQILQTKKQKLPSSNDLFAKDKAAMLFRRLNTLNPYPD